MRRRRKCVCVGAMIAAFGLGLFLACCFPSTFLIGVIAVAIVIIGIFMCKI